jgi:hypothetical protein
MSWFWAFRETIRRSYFLDMADPVRFEIGRFENSSRSFVRMEKALGHKRFEHLPFKNTKYIVSNLVKESNLKDEWEAVRYL